MIKKQVILDLEVGILTSKASKIFNQHNWLGLWAITEFQKVCKNIRKVAKKEGLYEAQNLFLNLTK